MTFDYPLDMTREQAMIRRADKLAVMVKRDYQYTGTDSVPNLAEFMDIVLDTISPSLRGLEAQIPLKRKLSRAKAILTKKTEEGESDKANYNQAVAALLAFLEEYKSTMAQI